METTLTLLVAGVAIFWWFGGFELLAMRKRSLLKKSIKPVFQSPTRDQLLLDLISTKATSIGQIDAFLISKNLAGDETWPETYHQKYPNNTSFTFLYANYLIRKGWLARGSGAGSAVTDEGAQQFWTCLTEAETLLQQLISNSTIAADCYEPLLIVYKGLGKQQEANDFYKTNASKAKSRLDFHLARMGQITPRWGGNMDDLLKLARDLFKQGNATTAALAAGWFEYAYEEEVKSLMKVIENAGEKESLISAFKQLNATPNIINSYEDYMLALAHNCFAVLFYYAGEKKLAKEALEKIRGYYTNYPWQFIDKDISRGFYQAAVKCRVNSFEGQA